MKIPESPPGSDRLLALLQSDPQRVAGLIAALTNAPAAATVGGAYPHWDKLRRLPAPEDLTHEDWWLGIKLARLPTMKVLPLTDASGAPFSFGSPDIVQERLHRIDQRTSGHIAMPEQVTSPESRNHYLVSSLIEESITSSQLEGAATTKKVARDMLRRGRRPSDRSERMILNNYRALEKVRALVGTPLTVDRILELQEVVTRGALDTHGAAGRLRTEDEDVHVTDGRGAVLHVPPVAGELPERLTALCAFANGDAPAFFVHPVLRAIILHFMLAYNHPFVDGNGRTARALFYWSMLSQRYWLFEYISISSAVKQSPARYSRAFLYVETDENDLTYFIDYHLEAIERAVLGLTEFIGRRVAQQRETLSLLRRSALFNYRQVALLGHALRNPSMRYTIASHRNSHRVSYATARKDLLELEERGMLRKTLIGKAYVFVPVVELARALRDHS